jgi:hypothetical protein
MAKRKIEAKKFRRDVRAGLSVKELAEKYELSERKVNKYIERFIAEGKLEPRPEDKPLQDEQKEEEQPPYEPTIELATVCDKCGGLKLADSNLCPKCDLGRTTEVADDGTIEFDLDGDTEHLAKAWDQDPDIADQVSISQELPGDLSEGKPEKGRRIRAIHIIPIAVVAAILIVAGGIMIGILPEPPFMRSAPTKVASDKTRWKTIDMTRQKGREAPKNAGMKKDDNKGPKNRKPPDIASGANTRAKPPKKSPPETEKETRTNLSRQKQMETPDNNLAEKKMAPEPMKIAANLNGAISAGTLMASTINGEVVTPAPRKEPEPDRSEVEKASPTRVATLVKEGDQPEEGHMEAGAPDLELPGSDIRSEFLMAVTEGDIGRVKDLLASGVDADTRDRNGNTALMLAAGMGDLKMARLLLEHGADAHSRNTRGLTALGWAYSPSGTQYVPLRERRAIVRLLKEHVRRANGGGEVSPIIAPR